MPLSKIGGGRGERGERPNQKKMISTLPKEIICEFFTFLSFTEIISSCRRINKEYNKIASKYIYYSNPTTFNNNTGHWKLLPSLHYEDELKLVAPIKIDDKIVSSYGTYKIEKVLKNIKGVWDGRVIGNIFRKISCIDFSRMSEKITDLGLFDLLENTTAFGAEVTTVDISNCKSLTSHAIRYLKTYLASSLEKLVMKNISVVLFDSYINEDSDKIFVNLKYLDVSENPNLCWFHLGNFLHSAPHLEFLDLKFTSVGSGELIDFSGLQCRHSLASLNLTGVPAFLPQNEQNILSLCTKFYNK